MKGSRSFADDLPKAAEITAGAGPRALARRPDVRLGTALVRPSVRTVEGPAGRVTAEPQVMRVLLALADAGGGVMSREDLLNVCWDGRIVGDDSINRAVAEVRRVAQETGASFNVETIPRVGYRLTGATPEAVEPGPVRPTRRWLALGAAGVATVAAGGAGVWLWQGLRSRGRVAGLLEHARHALRNELPDADQQGVGFLRQAIAIQPDNAEAWGMLALALRNVAENAPPEETAEAVRASDQAARRALALDPRQGDALTARATLSPPLGDWLGSEARLRDVLKVAPDNVAALSALVVMLQSVGYTRASWDVNERAAALDPLSPIPQYRRTLKLWIMGRMAEADLNAERSLQLWPRHPAVWNARLITFAFTRRAQAAMAMLDDPAMRPQTLPPPAIELWRTSLTALATRAPADVARARAANLDAARRSPGFAVNAIMILSILGEVDAAFAVTDGFFLRRGPLIGNLWTAEGQMPVNDQRWRRTMMLFTPASTALRADARFASLCRDIGLSEYWRRRGKGPEPSAPPA